MARRPSVESGVTLFCRGMRKMFREVPITL
jgi:hypothetical protein